MSEKTLGIVLPAYQIDPDQLNYYLEKLHDQFSPEKIILEYDKPKHVDEIEGEVSIQSFDRRRGKGAAIKHGFNLLDTDILLFADSDGSVSPENLRRIVEAVKEGASLAVGSRRHPDTKSAYHRTYIRKFLGDLLARIAGTMLEPSLYDYQCGAKAIAKEEWQQIEGDISQDGFGFDLELIVESGRHGFQIVEVPVEWVDKPGSTVSVVKDSFNIGKVLLELSWTRNR